MKKTIFLCVFVLLTVVCTMLSAQEPTKQSDWAQYYRYERENDSIRAMGSNPRVVFMGNSITDFWGSRRRDFFASVQAVSRGISGQTTQEMLSRFQADVVELKPEMVVILAGVNDIAMNNGPISIEHIVQNIVSMCEIARYHHIEPVLCSPLPCSYFYWRPELKPAQMVVELRDMIESYALKTNTRYVDFYSVLEDGNGGIQKMYSDDQCHPNQNGYMMMEEVIFPSLF